MKGGDRTEELYLRDILEAIGKVEDYVKDIDIGMIQDHPMVADAVVRNFTIIGEASNSVSDKFKKDNSELPWLEMSGMRNRLIHEYFGIKWTILWQTIENDLPQLKVQIEKVLESLRK